MTITAALSWFDEDPEMLHDFVLSLDGAVDKLVAVDGAYARYAYAATRSDPEQADALVDACDEINLPLDLYVPERIWQGQIEKRNFLTENALPGSDWIFTLDADCRLRGSASEFRRELEHVDVHRVNLEERTPADPDRSLDDTSPTPWHRWLADNTIRIGLVLRALPGLRYERFHWWVSGVDNGRRLWVFGGDNDSTYPHGASHDLEAPFWVEHRCHFRTEEEVLARRAFYADRVDLVAATGHEDP